MGTLTDDDLRSLLGEAAGSFAVPPEGPASVLAEVPPARRDLGARRRWAGLAAAAAVVVGASLAATQLQDQEPRLSPAAAPATADRDDLGVAAQEQRSEDGVPAAALQGGSTGSTTGGTAGAPGVAPPAAAPVAAPFAAPVADGARVVKTGTIALVAEDGQVTPVLTRVQGLAASLGGVVAGAKTQESGPTPSGSVTLRVPVARFEELVTAVRGLDAEVRSATTSGQDVTAQYADLEAQIRTLTAARERFLDILSRARSIGDVLAVQQRVDDVTGRIDRLEGTRRVLAAQSDRATLEVSVTEDGDPVVARERPDDGLSKAFADAWDGFTGGVEALVRASGVTVLVALCLAVAYAVGRLVWRASRRRLV